VPSKARILILLAGAVFAVSLTAGALTFATNGRSAPPSDSVGILDRAATAADHLPSAITASPAAAHLNATASRLSQTANGESVFVAPGTSHSTLCLVVTGHAYFGSCASQAALAAGAIYLTSPAGDGTMSVYALVPDGYTTATVGGNSVAVVRNSAVLQGVPESSLLTLSGPNGTRNVDLGAQEPRS
jgi:hypothetical protein